MTLSDIIASKLATHDPVPALSLGFDDVAASVEMAEAEVAPAPLVAPVAPAPLPGKTFSPRVSTTHAAPVELAAKPSPFVTEPAARPVVEPAAAAAVPPDGHGIPADLLRIAAVAFPEQKSESKADPDLLSTSEDPARFKTEHPIAVSTTAGPSLTAINLKPAAPVVKPFVSAPPAIAALSSTATDSAAAMPSVLSSWTTPPEEAKKRSPLVMVGSIAAAVALVAGLWMYRSTTKDVPPPEAAVPAVTANALPSAAPTPVVSSGQTEIYVVSDPPARSARTTEPEPARAKHEPAPQAASRRVIEVGPGQAKPQEQPPAELQAPKLVLAASNDAVNTINKISVAVPLAPKSELVPAKLASTVAPAYPALAREMNVYGAVVMRITISSTGSVSGVQVISGSGALRQAAVAAVRQWRYTPAMLNGSPTESTADVQVNFKR